MVIHTVHGLLTHDAIPFAPRAAFWCVEKFTASLCDLLLFQSREDSTAAVRTRLASPDKVRFLGNGIDTRRFTVANPDTRFSVRQRYGFTPGHVVVGTVGRLVREKGYCEFVAAAKVLTSRYPQLRFLVIAPSDADQNDALPETIFKPLEQIGVLVRLDWTADVEQLYPAFDIFVLPSYREGIPRACVEAAASGCPVIASDIRGCREVVLHGHSGLLVPPRNVAGLIDGLTRLIESPDLRDQMGVRARQLVLCNFDANDMLNRLINYYNEISAALFARAKPVPCATASPVPAAASRGAIANADRTAAEHPVRLAGTRASG
jgi:glycosyltransferase involved in cell wall biosynthesis